MTVNMKKVSERFMAKYVGEDVVKCLFPFKEIWGCCSVITCCWCCLCCCFCCGKCDPVEDEDIDFISPEESLSFPPETPPGDGIFVQLDPPPSDQSISSPSETPGENAPIMVQPSAINRNFGYWEKLQEIHAILPPVD